MLVARVNIAAVHRAFQAIKRPDLRPAFKDARKPLRVDIKDHRAKQQGPDSTWAPRAASTATRARLGRGRARKLLGRLPTTLATKVARDRIRMTSRVAWAQVQQTGGRVGHGSKLPARPFLWASTAVVQAIRDRVLARLNELWREVR